MANNRKFLGTFSCDIRVDTNPEYKFEDNIRDWILLQICTSVGIRTSYECFLAILSLSARDSAKCNFSAEDPRSKSVLESMAVHLVHDNKSESSLTLWNFHS